MENEKRRFVLIPRNIVGWIILGVCAVLANVVGNILVRSGTSNFPAFSIGGLLLGAIYFAVNLRRSS